jgi:hypothetical protein
VGEKKIVVRNERYVSDERITSRLATSHENTAQNHQQVTAGRWPAGGR